MPEHNDEISTEHLANPDVKHEHRDVNVRGVITFAVVLLVSALIIHLVLWGAMRSMEGAALKADPQVHPLSGTTPVEPPEPRLQPDPVTDMEKLRAREEQALSTYGWVDREAGIARIPIEQAIEMTVQRGLPARSGRAEERKQD